MPTLGSLIRGRRNQLGLTLQQVADAAGCTKSYLSTIETGRREHPPSEQILMRLENALRLDGGHLLGLARWDRTPSSVRRQVQAAQSQAAKAQRLLALLKENGNSLDVLHESGELAGLVEELDSNLDTQPLPLGQVPLINRVAAGYPAQFTDLDYPARAADEYITCPGLSDPQAFAARVVGDSMEPDYREGDIVIFSPERPTPPGTDCFVRLEPDHETTFKRVYFEEADERAAADGARNGTANGEASRRWRADGSGTSADGSMSATAARAAGTLGEACDGQRHRMSNGASHESSGDEGRGRENGCGRGDDAEPVSGSQRHNSNTNACGGVALQERVHRTARRKQPRIAPAAAAVDPSPQASQGSLMIRLQPLNPAYPPRVYPREQVAGLYAAAYVMRGV